MHYTLTNTRVIVFKRWCIRIPHKILYIYTQYIGVPTIEASWGLSLMSFEVGNAIAKA